MQRHNCCQGVHVRLMLVYATHGGVSDAVCCGMEWHFGGGQNNQTAKASTRSQRMQAKCCRRHAFLQPEPTPAGG
jgi:hypothetical protein